jgi:hypothetical protein
MKKLIAISVMIALIAGVVFAETSVSGNVEARLNLYEVTTGDHGEGYAGSFPKPVTGGSLGAGAIKLAGSADDGSLGGALRVRWHYVTGDGDATRWSQAFIWWKPFDQMRLWLGVDDDGMFETGQLTSWAFHQGSESYLTVHDWDFWRTIFPGNFDTFGAALSFFLVPGLDLNLVIPTGQPNGWPRHHDAAVKRKPELDTVYPGSLQLTVGYDIEDVGKIAFAYIGSGQNILDEPTDMGKLALSFYSGSLVDGLQFQLGASTDIWKDITAPIAVGAGVHFNAGDFGLKFRAGALIGLEETVPGTDPAPGPTNAPWYLSGGLGDSMFITANIMPSFTTDIGKICLDIGFSMLMPKEGDAENGFWINPYLKKGLPGGYFQIGLMVVNNINGGQGGGIGVIPLKTGSGDDIKDNPDRDKMRVYIPMLMGFNF